MIPTTSVSVNVTDLHPLFAHRLELFLADPRMAGYRVVSGVRSEAHQRRLYSGWLSRLPGFNLAANPDRYIGRHDGVTFRGSMHMQQSDGLGYAVDLRRPYGHSVGYADDLVRRVAPLYGLRQTVSSEWWHLQAFTFRSGWFQGPDLPPPPIPDFSYISRGGNRHGDPD